ncbi:male-specific lethal 1 homolog isoform X1 [Hydra vulgaris]|uniref:male-specific lethal 1 homolog isoform X1 n=1 Tax=Hydra vulgaris TaxID=6087 RepID=UPI001F5EC21D|nr:male-specific lethal 1 homolog [Hydra vulgaris]
MVAFQMEIEGNIQKENNFADIQPINRGPDYSANISNNQNEQVDKKPKSGFVIDNQLKDLLLLQLDLIEHQQSKITQKDKQIIALQGEKDQLEARLRRMERRLAIQKRHTIESEGTSVSKKPLFTGQKDLNRIGSKDFNRSSSKCISNAVVTVTSRNSKNFKFRSYMNTNRAYLDYPLNKLITSNNTINTKAEEIDKKISVPPWHVIEKKTLFFNNLDEDISDDAFTKRHAKPETDEIKRKRWDVQHMRQQRQHQLLTRKYNEKEDKSPVIFESLFRNPENAMVLEVSNIIPVCVLGNHIPVMKKCEMQLPWFSIAKREVQLREAKEKLMKKKKKSFLV